jgi:hypothetical protein
MSISDYIDPVATAKALVDVGAVEYSAGFGCCGKTEVR